MAKKIAVVFFNLGGPDSKNAIKPFLMNFFMDKNILQVPIPLRCFLAALISNKRSKREASDSYGELGNQSPLLENSRAQALAVERELNNAQTEYSYKSFVSMRYWHPMAPQVVREIRDWGPDQVIILPLYPQFSTTTTWSSLQQWNKALFQAGLAQATNMICCYPENKGFIEASADHVRIKINEARAAGHQKIRVLFSAHGLPEKIIKQGDPYQYQCEQTSAAIVKSLAIENLDWVNCYQSRVGPLKWIGPSTEEEIERAAKDGTAIVIYPHAFTQEHVETLVELDIEYRHKAEELGIKGYFVAKTVGTHPAFINGLADLVRQYQNDNSIQAEGGQCICPEQFGRCCMRIQKEAVYG